MGNVTEKTAEPLTTKEGQISKVTRSYVLWYRAGNSKPLERPFLSDLSFHDVVMRARRHCEVMGYKFLFIKHFFIDLDEMETARQNPNFSEDIGVDPLAFVKPKINAT